MLDRSMNGLSNEYIVNWEKMQALLKRKARDKTNVMNMSLTCPSTKTTYLKHQRR